MAGKNPGGIEKVLRLTDEMLDRASAGAWDAVADLEAERQDAMQTLQSDYADIDSGLLEQLKQLLDKNTQLVILAVAEKDRIVEEYRLSKNSEKADQAYRDIDTDT